MKYTGYLLLGTSFWLFPFAGEAAETPAVMSERISDKVREAYGLFDAAEEYYYATLFPEAIERYRRLADSIRADGKPLELLGILQCRIGQAFLFSDDFVSAYPCFEQAVAYFDIDFSRDIDFPLFRELKEKASYLQAFSSRHLKKYSLAIELLDRHLQKECPLTKEKARFESGLNHFILGSLVSAREHFVAVIEESQNRRLKVLSSLYLNRIRLAEGHYSEADRDLECLQKEISDTDELQVELAYLQGETAFLTGAYTKAIGHFEKTLTSNNLKGPQGIYESLYYSGRCRLALVESENLSEEELKEHLEKAEGSFLKVSEKHPEEHVYLALAHCYLVRGKRLNDAEAYAKAGEVLLHLDRFKSGEAKARALILRGEALRLAAPFDPDSLANSSSLFRCAAEAYEAGFKSAEKNDPRRAASLLKSSIYAYLKSDTHESLEKAFRILCRYLEEHADDLPRTDELRELHYLHAMIACRSVEKEEANASKEQCETAEKITLKAIAVCAEGSFSDACLNLLASFYLRQKRFDVAEKTYSALVDTFPQSVFAGNALYRGAYCSEKLGREVSTIQKYKRRLFENYPNSPLASRAYFEFYSYKQYLQGDRAAIKHLRAFRDKFPDTPLLITAYFLMGLDYKRERRNADGKSESKKNLMKAIHYFFKAEALFGEFHKNHLIEEDQMSYFSLIRYRSLLERALTNQAIAENSSAAKQIIYLQYAQELFLQINRELADGDHPGASYLTRADPFPKIRQETLYYLVLSYIESGATKSADRAIEQILSKYDSLGITKNYYLSCIYCEKGKTLFKKKEYEKALESFIRAEESGQESYLSVNQKLDLWIRQSMCHKALYRTDQAMLILSKVINDNTVSHLRVKAMFLRAEIYALQGRHELAKKQLEATAKKGGEWAIKAKVKLDEDYGH